LQSLIDFECEERSERRRDFELRFSFLELGAQQLPTFAIATQAKTSLSAVAAFAAAAQNFFNTMSAVPSLPSGVGELIRTAYNLVVQAQLITQRGNPSRGNGGDAQARAWKIPQAIHRGHAAEVST
jgi:hypothetical protein